jgi:hypothetical protein
VLRLDVGDDVTDEEIIDFAAQQYEKDFYDSFDAEDNFAVDIAKGFSSGALQAIANTAAGVQSGAAMAAGDDPDSEFLQKLQANAARIREWSQGVDKRLGLDEDFAQGFGGQVAKGFGQMAVQLPAALAGAVGGTAVAGPVGGVVGGLALGGGTMMAQMQTEAVMDAEQALNKNLNEFSEQEKDDTAVTALSYMTIGGLLEYAPVSKFLPKPLKKKVTNFFTKKGMLSGSEIKQVAKSLKQDVIEGALLEGMTEAAQGQLLDTLAASTYDDDRELMSYDVVKQRFNEALVGLVVGGGTTAVTGAVSRKIAPEATAEADTSGEQKFEVRFDIVNEDVGSDMTKQSEIKTIFAKTQEEAIKQAREIIIQNPKADVNSIQVSPIEEVIEREIKPDVDPVEEEVATTTVPTFTDKPTITGRPTVEFSEPTAPIKEEPLGIFGDTDVDSLDLTPEQKTEVNNIREEARIIAEGVEALRKESERVKEPEGIEGPEGVAMDATAIGKTVEGDYPTIGASIPVSQSTVDKIRELDRRQAEVIGREYIPRTTESIQRSVENNILRTPLQRAQPIVGASRYMKPTSVRTAQAVRDWKKNPNLSDSSQTKKAISELKRPDNKDVISMVRELLSSYDIGNGRVRVYRGAQEDSDVNVLSGWSLNPEIASDFQEQARDFGEGEITVATIPIKDVLYKDNTLFDDDSVFSEQELIFDTVENLVIEKQTTDNIKDTFTPKIKEEEAIIKSYRMMPAQQVFDEKGMYDPRLTEEDPYPATEIVEQMDDDVTLEYGEVTSEIVSGDAISESPTVGAAVNLPNAPQISRKQFKGKKGFFFFSDRTRVGNYTGLFPGEGINIKLQGGPAFAFIQENLDKLAGWAFTTENIFTKFLDKVKKTDGIGFITLYKKENLRANGTFLKAYVAEVKAAIKARRLTTKDFLEAANRAREQVVNLKTTDKETGKLKFTVARDGKGYKLFSKPFKSVASFEKAMELVGFDARGAMLVVKDKTSRRLLEGDKLAAVEKQIGKKRKIGNRLNKEVTKKESDLFYYIQRFPGEYNTGRLARKGNVSKGLPDVLKMIDLFTDPTLDGRDRGEVVGAVQFDKEQIGSTTAQELGTEEHLSYPLVIKGKGIGAFSDPTNVLNVVQINKRKNEALRSAETSMPVGTVGASTTNNLTPKQLQVIGSVVNKIKKLSSQLNIPIVERTNLPGGRDAQYNYETMTIEYDPALLSNRGKKGAESALREEVIHAAMHQVINRKSKGLSPKEAFIKTMERIGQSLTPQQRDQLNSVYGQQLGATDAGAEYTRFITQQLLYGRTTESFMLEGKAFDMVKSLLRAVHSTIVKALKGEIQTNDEVALLIRDTASLIRSADPEARVPYQAQTAAAQVVASKAEGKGEMSTDQLADPTEVDVEAVEKRKRKLLGAQSAKDLFYTPSRILQEISPKLYEIMQKWQQGIMTKSLDAKKLGQPFFKKLNAITDKKDLSKLERHLMYSPTAEQKDSPESKSIIAERDRLLRKYGLYNEFQLSIQPIFDTIYNEKKAAGNQNLGYRFDYFPRFIRDMESYLKFLGKSISSDFNTYLDSVNEKRIEKGEAVVNINTPYAAYIFNQYILSQRFKDTRLNLTKDEQRKVDFIEEDAMQFYYSPAESFSAYVDSSYKEIETTKLMGKSGGINFNIENLQKNIDQGLPIGTFGQLLVELTQDPNVDQQRLFIEAPNVINTMLAPSLRAGNDFLGGLNSFMYGALMIEPTSTLSNAYELAFAALDGGLLGIFPVIRSMFGPKVTLKEIGVDKEMFSAEYQPDTNGLRKLVDKGLKLTGFKRMDQFIKETTLTTNYNRYRRAAMKPKSSGAYKKLLAEIDFRMPSYKEKIIYDLRNNTPNSPEVRLFLFTKLSETQPISELELPLSVKKNPDMRTVYLMKTFIVKQVNFIFQRYGSVFAPGSKATVAEKIKAGQEFLLLLMFFQLVGVPIDALKDLLAGRDMYKNDYFFNSLFRIAGVSKYNAYQFERDPKAFAFSYFAPVAFQVPLDTIGQLQALVNEDTVANPERLLTPIPFSDLWYYRYGPGAKSQEKKRFRRRTEKQEFPIDIDSLLNL